MNIVAAKLRERQAAFISLHELLETIVKQTGCTLGDAAEFLKSALDEAEAEFDGHAPPWYTNKPYLQVADTREAKNMDSLLETVSIFGTYKIPF